MGLLTNKYIAFQFTKTLRSIIFSSSCEKLCQKFDEILKLEEQTTKKSILFFFTLRLCFHFFSLLLTRHAKMPSLKLKLQRQNFRVDFIFLFIHFYTENKNIFLGITINGYVAQIRLNHIIPHQSEYRYL